MNHIEAMKQALEALEELEQLIPVGATIAAISPLRAAIEEAEKAEPVVREFYPRKIATGELDFSEPSYGNQYELLPEWEWVEVSLYLHPAPIPKESISKILTEVMDIAVSNGADSRSMPDEYVEVAAWLCNIPSSSTTIPEGWQPVLDYTVLHQYAADMSLNYNDLCAIVRTSIIAVAAAPKPGEGK